MLIYDQCTSKEGRIRSVTGIPANRADNDLIVMARNSWVLTANSEETHWKKGQYLPFLIQWSLLKEKLQANNGNLVITIDEIYKERSSASSKGDI